METKDIKPRRRVERIVWEFGGAKSLSELLNINRETVRVWQVNDRVPAKWQSTLLDIAKQSGIELTAEDLIGG